MQGGEDYELRTISSQLEETYDAPLSPLSFLPLPLPPMEEESAEEEYETIPADK